MVRIGKGGYLNVPYDTPIQFFGLFLPYLGVFISFSLSTNIRGTDTEGIISEN